jgi:hypothetical protein
MDALLTTMQPVTNVPVPYKILLVVVYAVLCVYVTVQMIITLLGKNKKRSFNFGFLLICIFWVGVRLVWSIHFLVDDPNPSNYWDLANTAAVDIQFAACTFLMLFYMRMMMRTRWQDWRRRLATLVFVINALFDGFSIAVFILQQLYVTVFPKAPSPAPPHRPNSSAVAGSSSSSSGGGDGGLASSISSAGSVARHLLESVVEGGSSLLRRVLGDDDEAVPSPSPLPSALAINNIHSRSRLGAWSVSSSNSGSTDEPALELAYAPAPSPNDNGFSTALSDVCVGLTPPALTACDARWAGETARDRRSLAVERMLLLLLDAQVVTVVCVSVRVSVRVCACVSQ